MFNSIAFDVVLGLVFVYLLYSLFVTIIGELVITKLKTRSNLLRHAIDRMLNDGFNEEKKESILKSIKTPFSSKQDEEVTTTENTEQQKDTPPQDNSGTTRARQSLIARFLAKEPKEFKDSFAGVFYEQPSIKSITRLDGSKPSYISAENFADTLIALLRNACKTPGDATKPETPYDNIAAVLEKEQNRIVPGSNNKPLIIQNEPLNQLKNLMANATVFNDSKAVDKTQTLAGFKIQLMKWFEDTMDHTNGWFKNKLRVILFSLGFVFAAAFNADSIQLAKILATDKDARAQLVNMGVAVAKDTARYAPYVNKSGDTVRSHAIIDSGYARINKDLDAANKVLGIGWDLSGLIPDSVYVDEKMAGAAAATFAKALNEMKSLSDSIKKTEDSLQKEYGDTARYSLRKQNTDRQIATFSTHIMAIRKKEMAKQFDTASLDLLRKQADTASFKSELEFYNEKEKIARELTAQTSYRIQLQKDSAVLRSIAVDNGKVKKGRFYDHEFTVIDSVKPKPHSNVVAIYGRYEYKWWEVPFVFLGRTFFSLSVFGFIITAFAISLGAPFWFGLLKKLVDIRGSGVKPEERKDPIKSGV